MMFNKAFRFDFGRVRGLLAPRKPRHPLLRLALGLLGVALLCVLVVVGVFVGAAMIIVTLALKLLTKRKAAPVDPRVVDAEYRVVRKPTLPITH